MVRWMICKGTFCCGNALQVFESNKKPYIVAWNFNVALKVVSCDITLRGHPNFWNHHPRNFYFVIIFREESRIEQLYRVCSLQCLCITKPQGRTFTRKTSAPCIVWPAVYSSTPDWSYRVSLIETTVESLICGGSWARKCPIRRITECSFRRGVHLWEVKIYSQLSLSGHHCKADTSLRWTWMAGPGHLFVCK